MNPKALEGLLKQFLKVTGRDPSGIIVKRVKIDEEIYIAVCFKEKEDEPEKGAQ